MMQMDCKAHLMTWHGKVRTEWRTVSAAPLNLGSGFSRETPALDSFLSHTKSKPHNEKR